MNSNVFSGLSLVLLAAVFMLQGDPVNIAQAQEDSCVGCHTEETPGVVSDWKNSAHAANQIGCDACHGSEHTSAKDVEEAKLATHEVCAQCHSKQVEQYKSGKHSLAWEAVNVMPTTHFQPMALLQGQEGCTGCHSIGIKSEEEIKAIRETGYRYEVSACDSCHTRHLFSKREASSPQACRTCHMGFDHPQWEMYSSSKHGVRYHLKETGALPEDAVAPTCQTCHMPDGDHANITAWGFLAVRLPLPEDEQWARDRTVVLKGLGVLSPSGEPTERLEALKAVNVARLDQESWQTLRNEMIAICSDCHAETFARKELEKGDMMIREADRLMAQGITTVADLYDKGILKKPENYAFDYPDLLTFHDAPTAIEQHLWVMFLENRMRTFQGAFHQNPDYTMWYGWSGMLRELAFIQSEAEDLLWKAEQEKGKAQQE
ncbi:MAG: multiheme c-type cytochrome [Desulfovibrionales bacterium]